MNRDPAVPPDPFDELAARVADGDAIDWEKLGASRRFQGNELAALKLIGQLRLTPDVALASPGAAAPPPPALPPLEQGFELVAELGKGAFATVWRARDKALGRDVALKLLNERTLTTPAARARFIAEARLLASLDHPNIVRIHSIDEHDGKLRLSLELLDGQTLEQWSRNNGPLSAAEAAQIGADLCRALAAIHGKGLVHGDVKPANVMRAGGGRIVLLDFGIARAARTPRDLQRADVAGTPLFMAPEQFRDPPHAGPKSDLFALGVLLYWLVARRHPIEAASVEELIALLREGKVVPLLDRCPDVAPEFAAIVGKALAREEAERFESAGAMEIALRRFIAGEAARDPGVASGAAAAGRGARWLVAAAVLLSVGVLAWAWGNRSAGPRRGGGANAIEQSPLLVGEPSWYRYDGPDDRHPLREGDHIHIRDQFQLDLEAKQDVYVYVINQDSSGTVNVIFPTPTSSRLANPIAGGAKVILPGPLISDPASLGVWQISSTPAGGGYEDFFLVVTSAPYKPLEQLVATFPHDGANLEDLDAGSRDAVTRGIGADATKPRPVVASRKSRLRVDDEIEKIVPNVVEDGIRIRRFNFRLLNP